MGDFISLRNINIFSNRGVISLLRLYFQRRDLLWAFISRDLKSRYVGSSLGFFWTVINPVLMLVTYTFIFSILLKLEFQAETGTFDFALYLFCGLLPWLAVQDSLQRGSSSLMENANLIKNVNFPSSFVPTHIVFSNVINELIGLGILLIAIVVSPYQLHWTVFLIPLVLVLQVFFTLGLTWLFSCFTVFFRDTVHFLSVVLMIWMFITPIFYPSSVYPDRLVILLDINPMHHIVSIYRDLLLAGQFPDFSNIFYLSVFSLISFLIGYRVFSKNQSSFADYI